MREQALTQMKQSDFYQSLNSGNGIDNFLLSIKYYRAELSTLCDQLGLLTAIDSQDPDDISERIGLFHSHFVNFVKKFEIGRLKAAARGIEENHEIQGILEKIQDRLDAVSRRLELNYPTKFQSLQLSFEMMKSIELSQIDVCLWGLLTISKDIKERATQKFASEDSVVIAADRVDTVLNNEMDLAHARDIIE
jgi:hypothetical protein